MVKIYTPVSNFTGEICTVEFIDGVGETENPRLIAWFSERRYRLEDVNLEDVNKKKPGRKGKKKDV